MGIKQHAEAAAKVYQHAENATDELMLENDETVRLWGIAPKVIAKHMQAAVDEATAEQAATIAKQAARIAELEALGPLIEEYASSKRYVGVLVEREKYEEAVKWRDKYEATFSKIDAIMKGGA